METIKRKRSVTPLVGTDAKKSRYLEPYSGRRIHHDSSHPSSNRFRQHRHGYRDDRKWREEDRKTGNGRRWGRGISRERGAHSRPYRGRQRGKRKWEEREGRRSWEKRNGMKRTKRDLFSEPSDAAVKYGVDPEGLECQVNKYVWEDIKENKEQTITFLHDIFQSPNRHCVRRAFKILQKGKFFEREDVKCLLERTLSQRTIDETNITVRMAGNIVKSYCTFLNSIGNVDRDMQQLLNRFETLPAKSQSPQPLEDFDDLKSPADCDLGIVLQPGIKALYNNPTFDKSKITDIFENSRSLLEHVYHFYKEDIRRPLIRGLRRLRFFLRKGQIDLEQFRDDDIRVYRNVQIISSVITNPYQGLAWDIQLDTTQPLVKTIMNRKRRLLQRGTLVCISDDVFKENIVYGTIVESDKENDMAMNGIVRVEFQRRFDNSRSNVGQTYTLVESKSNCLAYTGALIAVRKKLDYNEQIPFEKQIVYHQQRFNPPRYLSHTSDGKRQISFECLRMKSDIAVEGDMDKTPQDVTGIVTDIMEGMLSKLCAEQANLHVVQSETLSSLDASDISPDGDTTLVKEIEEGMFSTVCATEPRVNFFENDKSWPSPNDLGMDISQYRAFFDGLTQELSLIQGPPGTGKTVMALKILETFLNNENVWNKKDIKPIIILSYTNHALDQFLEGIARMPKMCSAPPPDIIRVGSRCKLGSLDKYNLLHRRKENNSITRENALSCLHSTAKHHTKISEAIRTYLTSIVHEQFLLEVKVIPEHLSQSLKNVSLKSLPSDKTYLCKWLGIFSSDFVPKKRKNKESVDTNEEIDADESSFFDRLGLGTEEEDFTMDPIRPEEQDHVRALMQYPTPIVTSETNNDLIMGIKYWSFIKSDEKLAILQEVKRRIMRTTPMTVAEESQVQDVWDLSDNDRWRLYKLWIHKILTALKDDMISAQKTYKIAYCRYQECRLSEDVKIYQKARIIAMTTTRAANDYEILRKINSKIMVIEEAAEVPDLHILVSLVPSLQHLVMIGDHQQLRPGYNDYRTAKRYGLDVSVFERLITSGLQFQRLQFQHRMRPGIADLLTPSIYSELLNHESVMDIEDVRGIQKNVYFLNHNECEYAETHKDTKSHKNQHEVDFIAQLYRYLRLQGYDSGDITVLTTYKEQERLLRAAIKKVEEDDSLVSWNSANGDIEVSTTQQEQEPLLKTAKQAIENRYRSVARNSCGDFGHQNLQQISRSQLDLHNRNPFSKRSSINTMQLENFKRFKENDKGVRVTTVDNFQGEENKIILLSLVRSNSEGTIGFLKESNRICVALSRAKAGLYAIGDCNMLRRKNDLWEQILQKAEAKGYVGGSLTLYCKNHPQTKTDVAKAVDFQKVPDGGCGQKCSARLACGHDCTRNCHTNDPNHTLRQCKAVCSKRCSSGHECKSLCYQCQPKCSPCTFKVSKTLPSCGHNVSVPCFRQLNDCKCTERCKIILECGHQCQSKCGMKCNNSENCNELVKTTADCGHEIQTACHTKNDPICSVPCSTKLICGHFCKGKCRSCFAGHLHQQCREKNQVKLQCGHTITTDCVQKDWIEKKYGNIECQRQCRWRCKHLSCDKRCGEPCTRQPCNYRCKQRLRCHHLCDLLMCDHNGDHWCGRCSRKRVNGGLPRTKLQVRNPHYIRLQRCGCIFQTEVLDEYLQNQEDISLSCPNCEEEISDMRYHNLRKTSKRLIRFSEKHLELQVHLQTELLYLVELVNLFNSDKSLKLKYDSVVQRLYDRLKNDRNLLSVQELWNLSLVFPKMVISFERCIERSKSKPEIMSEELQSQLVKCKNAHVSFPDVFGNIKNQQSERNNELDNFAKMVSKESTMVTILPYTRQQSL